MELSRKINRCEVLKRQDADKVPPVASGSLDTGQANCSGLVAGALAEGAAGVLALRLAGCSRVGTHMCASVCLCVGMWAVSPCACVHTHGCHAPYRMWTMPAVLCGPVSAW